MIHSLNYVTCSEFWGVKIGLALMKYFDVIYLIGNGADTLIIFLLPGEANYLNLVYVCVIMCVVGAFAIPFFPKTQKVSKK